MYNRIRAGICSGFFTAVVLFFFLLLELASAFLTQIPSDKLKMIDSESKMETATQGENACPFLCPRTSACLKCMHVHKHWSALLRSCKHVSAVAGDNVLAQNACTLVGNARRRTGLQHWFPDTFKECEETANIQCVNLKAISVLLML